MSVGRPNKVFASAHVQVVPPVLQAESTPPHHPTDVVFSPVAPASPTFRDHHVLSVLLLAHGSRLIQDSSHASILIFLEH